LLVLHAIERNFTGASCQSFRQSIPFCNGGQARDISVPSSCTRAYRGDDGLKITIFGLTLSSSWGNGHATPYRALLRALWRRGHEVTFFEKDQSYYASRRDFATCDF